MIKQVITGHVQDERQLRDAFSDRVGPSDRIFRTEEGYVVVSSDHDENVDGDALGPVADWYE